MFNNSFDNTYKECLKENILADFSSGFQKGLEKSEKGLAPWQKDNPKGDKEDKNNKNENYIGFQNIPKVGEKILFPLKNSKYIKAKVLTSINQKGQWEIELLNDKNSADPLYYYTSDVYPDGVITTPIHMKSKHTTPQQINSVEGPYKDCIVGFNTPYSKWLKEKDTLQNY
jgi:hypothetical protein